MKLSQMILPMKTVEFEYPGVEDLFFSLSFISKKELNRMRKDNTKMIKSKVTNHFAEELDEEGFMREYVPTVIKGWRGLTLGNIQEFLCMPEDADQETKVPYDKDNAYELLTNSQDLDTWVSEMISNLENFRNRESKKNEEE